MARSAKTNPPPDPSPVVTAVTQAVVTVSTAGETVVVTADLPVADALAPPLQSPLAARTRSL